MTVSEQDIPEASGGNSATLQTSPGSWRLDASWPAAIFLVALALRLTYVMQIQASPFYGHETMDPWYYSEWAKAFANSETFVDGPYWRGPLYPWFLGTLYKTFGTTPIVPRIAQAVLGSLSCVLLYLIGRRVFSRSVAVIAGFAAATYWAFLYFDAELLIVVLAVFLDLLLLWLLLRTGDRPSPVLWLISGAVLGLSTIARPNILIFAPAVLVWLVVMHRGRWRRALGYGACFVAGTALLVLPVTIRNYVVGHDTVLICSSGGMNFYIGNNPESDGMTAVVPGTPPDFWEGYHASIAIAERAAGRKLKASEVSEYYAGLAFEFIREQPLSAAALMLKKLGCFWTRAEISNNQSIGFVTEHYTPIVRFLPLTFWIIGPLGVLGWLLSLRQAKHLFPLWGFALIYMLGVVAFFATSRYRVPIVPVLILLGSYAACWLVQVVRAGRWRSVLFAAAVLVPMSFAVARVPLDLDVEMAQGYQEAGLALARQGKSAEAEKLLTEAVERLPGQARAWFGLGHLLMTQGDYARAEECFVRVSQIDPTYPVHNNLGAILAARGKLDAAIRMFRTVLQSDSHDVAALANLGSLLIRQGQTDEGLKHLRRARELDPARTKDLFCTTALLIIRQRRFGDAIKTLQEGLAGTPDEIRTLNLLAKMLATCPDARHRDPAEAVRLAEHACRLPGQPTPDTLDTAAAAYFAAGQHNKAAETARRALELAKLRGNKGQVTQIEARLKKYETAASAP